MGGFGGVLKNASIGVASTAGKAYIHSVGITDDPELCWQHTENQDGFLESMAAAAQAVHNWFGRGKNILYINVMNNMSVDCDCDGNPAEPKLKDMGILASLDPVALDKACLDLVFNHKAASGDDEQPLIGGRHTKSQDNGINGTRGTNGGPGVQLMTELLPYHEEFSHSDAGILVVNSEIEGYKLG